MRTLQVICPLRTPSRSRLVNSMNKSVRRGSCSENFHESCNVTLIDPTLRLFKSVNQTDTLLD